VRWLALLALASSSAIAQSLAPGEWEFVSDIAMPGLPRPQQSASLACLAREQAKDPMHWGRGAHLPSDCRVVSQKLGPEATSWQLECPASGMKGAGKAQIGSSTMTSELQLSGGVRVQTRGQRRGPCKP
jgi:hypothetical protein